MRVRVPGGFARGAEVIGGVLYVSGYVMRTVEIGQSGLVLVEATDAERKLLRIHGFHMPEEEKPVRRR